MNIGIYVYEGAEVLDFSGPFEVFSTASRLAGLNWNVLLLGEQAKLIKARGGFHIQPHFSIEQHPSLDVLMVVGGVHSAELDKEHVIQWITKQGKSAEWLVSVCTGAFLLAQAGFLGGQKVTTHWEDIEDLRSQYPRLTVVDDERWVQEGTVLTSGGISAGMDMSLHLVSQWESTELANQTAEQMEYRWLKGSEYSV